MQGLVVCKNADLFTIEKDDQNFLLKPSGKTKAKGVFVGDIVEFDDNITKVFDRKNLLIRPPVANIDRMFIVISQTPKPDFVLVDKIIIYCILNDILPIIVINKSDKCSEEFTQKVKYEYGHSYQILHTSAIQNKVMELENEIKGLCVLAGQSAVGKSSLINAILKSDGEKVGSLSKKIERGKQTTRIVKLFNINGNYLADTAGFSLLDLSMVSGLDASGLAAYYPEFLKGRGECKYRSCQHEGGDCGVIRALEKGEISRQRYQNYLKILQELKVAKKY